MRYLRRKFREDYMEYDETKEKKEVIIEKENGDGTAIGGDLIRSLITLGILNFLYLIIKLIFLKQKKRISLLIQLQ